MPKLPPLPLPTASGDPVSNVAVVAEPPQDDSAVAVAPSNVAVAPSKKLPGWVWFVIVGVGYTTYLAITRTMPQWLYYFVGGIYETVGITVFKYAVVDGQVWSLPAGAAAISCFALGAFVGWLIGRGKKS